MLRIRKRTVLLAVAGLIVVLPLLAVVRLYTELRWTTKQYVILSAPTSTGKLSSDRPLVLRTVFLNTHLLPIRIERIAGNRSDGLYRAKRIAEALGDYDIIGLCEAFDPSCLEALINSLQEHSSNAFSVTSSPLPPIGCLLGGGCVLLSRYPIESFEVVNYSTASSFWNYGFCADGFAAKGAIFARIRLPGHMTADSSLTCVVTHLEARSPDCRVKQTTELGDFLRHWSRSCPLIVMGDFNTVAEPSEAYTNLKNTLMIEGAQLRDSWKELGNSRGGTSEPLSEDGGDRIDYVFYKPGSADRRIQLTDVKVRRLRDQRVGSLSDHAAIEADFDLLKPQFEK